MIGHALAVDHSVRVCGDMTLSTADIFDCGCITNCPPKLFHRKVDEKHDLQRILWALEKKYASFSTILRKSQMAVWKEGVQAREHSRQNRLLHMKLRRNSAGSLVNASSVDLTEPFDLSG